MAKRPTESAGHLNTLALEFVAGVLLPAYDPSTSQIRGSALVESTGILGSNSALGRILLCSSVYNRVAIPSCRSWLMQTTLRDLVLARLSAGKSRLASTPIIAMTTINSISVKPGRQAGVAQISNLCTPKAFGAGRRASSLRDLRIIQRPGRFAGLPIGNRRYSRLEICATS